MSLVIRRVTSLPDPLVANSVYLLAVSATELQVVTVGLTAADVRKTVINSEISSAITTALAGIGLATGTLNSEVLSAIGTAIGNISIADGSLTADVGAAISTAIAGLDQSNSAQLCADIAARDALTLTKSSFVLVQDATGDVTVTTGAALYFYNVADDTFTKVAEYESMDLTIPNKSILELFSIVNGQLAYNGELVGTVQAGTNEW